MIIFGHNLPKLREDENGTIYLSTSRENTSKFSYNINQRPTLYDELLALVDEILENEPYPFYITKIELPALMYIIGTGIYKREIKKDKARQLSRFIKALFTTLHNHYSKEDETHG